MLKAFHVIKYFMTIQLLRAGRVQDYSPEAWTAYYLSGTRRHSRHQFLQEELQANADQVCHLRYPMKYVLFRSRLDSI